MLIDLSTLGHLFFGPFYPSIPHANTALFQGFIQRSSDTGAGMNKECRFMHRFSKFTPTTTEDFVGQGLDTSDTGSLAPFDPTLEPPLSFSCAFDTLL